MGLALVLLGFGGLCVLLVLVYPFIGIRGEMPRRDYWMLHGCSVVTIVGIAAFFAPIATGAGQLIPSSVEWPIGRSVDAVELASGHYAVAHDPTGRIQIYDQELRFVRGWHVEIAGGAMELSIPPGQADVLQVYGHRTKQRSFYTVDGELVSQEASEREPVFVDETRQRTIKLAQRWWQWPLTSPIYGGSLMLLGTLGQNAIGVTNRLEMHNGLKWRQL